MKKLLLILQAVTLFGMSNIVRADTVTGNVEAVSYCEYGNDVFMSFINVDGSWYRSAGRNGTDSMGYFVQFQMNMTVPLAALTSNKTVTLTFTSSSENFCGKSVVGRLDWAGSQHADIQINAN